MAKEGSMINIQAWSSLTSISLRAVDSPSRPPMATRVMPTIPKVIDAYMNIFVAIFCMPILYQQIKISPIWRDLKVSRIFEMFQVMTLQNS